MNFSQLLDVDTLAPTPVIYLRTNLQQIVQTVRNKQCCTVLGPRYRGKSGLMQEAAMQLQEQGAYYTSYISLKKIPTLNEDSFFIGLYSDVLLVSEAEFYTRLYMGIERGLPALKSASILSPPRSADGFRDALLTLVRRAKRHIVVFIDDLETAPPNLVATLLGALAAVHTAVTEPDQANFFAVICGALSFSQQTSAAVEWFRSVSQMVWVDELYPDERAAVVRAACHRQSIELTEHSLDALLSQTGGDQFLIEHVLNNCFNLMAPRHQTRLTPARIAEGIDLLVELPPDTYLHELQRFIESDPTLMYTALGIIDHGQTAVSQIKLNVKENPNQLDLCGVFNRSQEHYDVKSDLWRRLLKQNLNVARIGGLYAIAGYWQEAFRYLGTAVNHGDNSVKSELFTAIINAMYTRESAQGAGEFLWQGLRAAYPENESHLYLIIENSLRPIQPQQKSGPEAIIPLTAITQPEVAALHGANYAVANDSQEETRLYIPLRDEANQPVGLVTFGDLVSPNSPYQRREELLQLIGFLRQAAVAIADRGRFATLLLSAENRVDKLNVLNTILTKILHHPHPSEDKLLQLCLTGVTSHLGLGFSRAVLFIADQQQHYLIGRQAFGHLTRKESAQAEAYYARLDLDTLITSMFSTMHGESPLQHRVKQIRIPLVANHNNGLVEAFHQVKPITTLNQRSRIPLPVIFAQAIGVPDQFALIPLKAGRQTLGVLYVDDKFTGKRIDKERFELLQTFTNQTALLLKNARTLLAEKKRTKGFKKLLKIEGALNDQITNSVKGVLDEAARSACNLFGADNAVIYPLQLGLPKSQYVYDVENVSAIGTRQAVRPTGRTRSRSGIATQVLRSGLWHVPSVSKSGGNGHGRSLLASTFIAREKVAAFVGIRLGSLEKPVGILYLNWLTPHFLSQEELTILELLANFIAIAIPSARSYQRIQSDLTLRNQELQGLSQVFSSSLLIDSEDEIDLAIHITLQTAQTYAKAPYVYLIRDEPHSVWRVYRLASSGNMRSEYHTKIPAGLIEHVFSASRTELITNSGRPETGKFPKRFHDDSRCGLAVPVRLQGHCFAVLYLETPHPDGLSESQIPHLEDIARRLAMTLEKADRTQALRQLQDISHQLTAEIDLQSSLAFLVRQARAALRAVDVISLYYADQDAGQLMLGYMSGDQSEAIIGQHLTPPEPIVAQISNAKQPLFIADIRHHTAVRGAFFDTDQTVKSAAAFPLRIGEQEVGCMFFGYHFFHRFSKDERSLLNLFAQLAALAILRATLHDEAERRRKRLDTIGRMTPIISASLEQEAVFKAVLHEVHELFPKADNICFVERNPAGTIIMLQDSAYYHMDNIPFRPDDDHTMLQERRGIAARVLATGTPALVGDVTQDADYIPAISSTRSELCMSLQFEEDSRVGLVLESDQLNAFSLADLRLLEMLTGYIGIAIQNARQFEQARARELKERTAMMATGLIHDINTAVANIPDLVDELEEKILAGQDPSFPLEDLRQNASVTDKISARLRDFVITGQYQPQLIDVPQLIKKAIAISKTHEMPHVTTSYILCDPLPQIEADPLWIELLLKNLLVNAYTAAPPNRDGSVRIETETQSDYLLLHVRDNGNGIPPEIKEDIFKFGISTKKNSNKMQGVGLYHCRLIAEAHNGKLTLDCEPGADTVFTVRLPITANNNHLEKEQGNG
ncbi:MAG: GAF domain-containing protein [Chloroflexi bacterium]|nr:GAF domain-containing protein [Chloroflexota bacterium]